MTRGEVVEVVSLGEVKRGGVWKSRKVGNDVGGRVRSVGGAEMPFANEGKVDDVSE